MATTEGFRADWAQKDFYKQLGFREHPTGMSKVVGSWLRKDS